MHLGRNFTIILLLFVLVNIAVVSAGDVNSTDAVQNDNFTSERVFEEAGNISNDNGTFEKTTPEITVKSNDVKSKDTLEIYLSNSSGSPLTSKKLTAVIGNNQYSISTNSKGIAKLGINLNAAKYKLNVSFAGDEYYNPVSKIISLKVSKLSTKISPTSNFAMRGHYLSFYLYDQRNNPLSSKKITFKFNGKSYTKSTGKNGRIDFKVNSYNNKNAMKFKFKGDKKYKASSKRITLYLVSGKSLKIANSKLLTKGYLRIYLSASTKSEISKKTIKISIGNSKFTKKTTSEGIAVIKPKMSSNVYLIKASLGKYWVSKRVKCVDGDVMDPMAENISLKKGVPDIDVMPGNYVMGDGSATYTLTKSQYREVIKRDSRCLFLNNKLSKYTFFKTKKHPNTNHIIKREKWNVIERAINLKLVYANKPHYWPSEIKVSLKGKSYTYPEVRDVQSNGVNCGPTAASVCTQVLRNYFCERYLASQMGTNAEGTPCPKIVSGLEKNGFNCTYFFKATFKDALKELAKGGCALIFHAPYHYVAILDISRDGKQVLVSNSYGTYDNIPSKWVKVNTLKNKFSKWEESLIVRLNYNLSNSAKESVKCFYHSMGMNWIRQNTNQIMGLS